MNLTPDHRRAVAAAFIVFAVVNAALYVTVSYTRPSTDQLHASHLHGYQQVQKGDLQATVRPQLKAPRWIKALSTDLHVPNKSSSRRLNSHSAASGHLNGPVVITRQNSTTSKTKGIQPHHQLQSAGTTMAAHGKGGVEFDALRVLQLFQSCKQENNDLLIDCYNDAYEELCKLFKLFGTAFSFVSSDVVEKIEILREYRKSDKGEEYKTVQSMVKYEVENNLTIQKHKASGCRTLLRLHRALEFISALLEKIRDTDSKSKFSHEATAAYDATLAKFHPWLIKKAVHVAMYVLPNRQQLLTKMRVEDTPEGIGQINNLIQVLKEVYNITQEEYASHKLLDLP